ncbi:DUF721 domain-containing protein [Candidatus Curtissbacteria bacterium]|nr:DUF721 domain-containing protein [Candidatus Curtissbacteria bacterium]
MFTPINKLIVTPRKSKTSEILFTLSVRKAFGDVLREEKGLPKEIIKAARATSFKNGELTVKVVGLARAELLMRAGGLIRDINKMLGRRVVWKIKFRGY